MTAAPFSRLACRSAGLAVLALASLRGAQPPDGTLAPEVVFFEEPNGAKAFEMLENGQMDIYAYGMSDAEIQRKIEQSAHTTYALSYGNIWELTLNNSGPVLRNGRLNPFASQEIREALNWLLDRNYIAQELCHGLARPKVVALVSAFTDYARLADVARRLELHYAYDPARAREQIDRGMAALGATRRNDRWFFRDQPVELTFLIRTEDVRRRIGDYIATQLESAGFAVDRQYKTAAEASPIWIASDPEDGLWHLYTGGWVNTAIDRDEGDQFDYFYTPRGRPETLWQSYRPSAALDRVADRLKRTDYHTWDERMDLMRQALELSTRESIRVWLADTSNYNPLRRDVRVAADLAAGIWGSFLWAHSNRFTGTARDTMRIGMPSIMTGPWNPMAGTNWVYDAMVMRGTSLDATVPDPYTGVFLPLAVQRAEVTVREGTPMIQSLDWVSLDSVPAITVPPDALIDWDPVEQHFISVQEKHPGGLTARTRTVLHFDPELFHRTWHDGTPITFADLYYALIVGFDRAYPQSAIFDEAAVPAFESFRQHFRGFRIRSRDPLVYEYYSDQAFSDAEYHVDQAAIIPNLRNILNSDSASKMTPWQAFDIGVQAEAARQLAFSEDKAEKLKIEKTSYIAGPSLPILAELTRRSEASARIPYPRELGAYITAEDSRARFGALRQWYETRHHFWIGNGPYRIESIHPIEKTIVGVRTDDFRQADPRFLAYTEPHLADVAVSGPLRVTIGQPADFNIAVTFQGAPYPAADVNFVRYLVINSRNEIVATGDAEAGTDGTWTARLAADVTGQLAPGANRLEVAVAPRIVSIASFGSARFVSLGAR